MSSSSVNGGKSKVLIISGIAGLAVVGGAAYAVYKKNKKPASCVAVEEEEDVFTAPIPKEDVTAKTQPIVGGAAKASTPKANEGPHAVPVISSVVPKAVLDAKTAVTHKDVDHLLEEALDEVDEVVEVKVPAGSAVARAATAVDAVASLTGEQTFAHLGLTLTVPPGWVVREELSPMPNIAMLTMSKPEFAEEMAAGEMGQVPIIILSVEDISGENLDLFEFKEKSKQMAMEQMLMMTNGMISPAVKKDAKEKLGVFSHQLEYAQSVPPLFDISVRNLLHVHNGLAYVFQMMCAPAVLSTYGPVFDSIARTVQIGSLQDTAIGTVVVPTGKVKIHVPPSWQWRFPGARNALITFTTPSTVKREQISLFMAKEMPKNEQTSVAPRTVDDVQIFVSASGAKRRKTFTWGDFALVVDPQQQNTSFLEESLLIKVLKSAELSSETAAIKQGALYLNPVHGYKFWALAGCRIISTCIGGGTVVYAPKGIPTDPSMPVLEDAQGPTVTIRVGTPETDPECMGSLDEWEKRMTTEKTDSDISNVQRVDVNGKDCLTFLSKEVQEVGPGQQLQLQGKVHIFVNNGTTTLIRWETPQSVWRKNERDLDTFIKHFSFM